MIRKGSPTLPFTKVPNPMVKMVAYTGADAPGQAVYDYDANGRLLTETRGGITTSYSYNKAGMVSSMTNTPGTSYTYQYRLDGNQISRSAVTGVAAAETTQYTYNNLGQLKSETQNGWTASYDYDTRGNRVTARITDQLGIDFKNQTGIKNYDYDANNRLLRETNVNGSTTKITNYEYDPNGNIVFKGLEKYEDSGSEAESIEMSIAGSGAATQEPLATFYAYNYQNQLIGMQSDSVLAEYKYDAAGRRSSKTVNGVTTNHIWDGSNIVYETEGSGAYKAAFYRGVHLIGSKAAGIALDYYLYDEKGSVTGMKTDTASSYRYEAFGIQVESGTSARYNPFRYTGEYMDEESGLIYLRNRYYAPSSGRFLTEDPAMDGLNWYVYCNNNSVNFTDKLGLYPGEWDRNITNLSQQSVSNIKSAIKAKEHGVITVEEMAANIVLNGGTLLEKLKMVTVVETENSVNITANVVLRGNLVNTVIQGSTTYGQAAIEGVEEVWSGTFEGREVITKCNVIADVEYDSRIYETPVIFDINALSSDGGSPKTPTKKTISFLYNGNSEAEDGQIEYSYEEFKIVAGHEFGHSAFMLSDAYNDPFLTISAINSTIMGNVPRGSKISRAQPVDFAMVLKSAQNGFKSYMRFNKSPELLDKYLVNWRYRE